MAKSAHNRARNPKMFFLRTILRLSGSRFTVGYFALFIFFEIVDEATSNLEP